MKLISAFFISILGVSLYFVRNSHMFPYLTVDKAKIVAIAKREAAKKEFDYEAFNSSIDKKDGFKYNFTFLGKEKALNVKFNDDLKSIVELESIQDNKRILILNVIFLFLSIIILYYTLNYRVVSKFSFFMALAFMSWALASIWAGLEGSFVYRIYKVFMANDYVLFIFFLSIFASILIKVASIMDRKAFPNNISFVQIFDKGFLSSKKFNYFLIEGYGIALLLILARLHFNSISSGLSSNIFYFNHLLPIGTFLSAFIFAVIGESIFRFIPISLAYNWKKNNFSLILASLISSAIFSFFYFDSSSIIFNFIFSMIMSFTYINYGMFFTSFVSFVYNFIVLSADLIFSISIFNLVNLIVFILILLYPFRFTILFYFIGSKGEVKLNKEVSLKSEKSLFLKMLVSLFPAILIVRSTYIIFSLI